MQKMLDKAHDFSYLSKPEFRSKNGLLLTQNDHKRIIGIEYEAPFTFLITNPFGKS